MASNHTSFYNSWRTVMGDAGKQLICSWHVNKNWKIKACSKIKIGEKES